MASPRIAVAPQNLGKLDREEPDSADSITPQTMMILEDPIQASSIAWHTLAESGPTEETQPKRAGLVNHQSLLERVPEVAMIFGDQEMTGKLALEVVA